MSKANAKSAQLAYIAEVTPGVTPATPVFKLLRILGESLDVVRSVVFSSEIDGKRGEKNVSLVSRRGAGGANFEFSYATFDDLLEAALRGAWTTDVLTSGNTQKTFTVETRFETGSTDIFKRHVGAEVESLSLSMRSAQNITGSVEFMARDSDYANAIVSGATYTAPNTNPVLNGADFASLDMDGLTIGCVSALDINIKNNLDALQCLGALIATDMTAGKLEVTGSLSIILSDAEYDVLQAGSGVTQTSLSFDVGRDSGSKYTIELPNIIFEGMKVVAEDSESGSVLINTNYRALQASSLTNEVIRVTREV